jgi:hypothetical protein
VNFCVLPVDCADNAHGFLPPHPYLYFERSMTEFFIHRKGAKIAKKIFNEINVFFASFVVNNISDSISEKL